MMWISFACILFIFYAIQTYTPTVLLKEGFGLNSSFLLTTIIVLTSIPGKYLAAYAVERRGRKFTLIAFTLIAAVSALVFGFAHSAGMALFAGCVMSFFGIGVDPVIKIFGAEQYPTSDCQFIRDLAVQFLCGLQHLNRTSGGPPVVFMNAAWNLSLSLQASPFSVELPSLL